MSSDRLVLAGLLVWAAIGCRDDPQSDKDVPAGETGDTAAGEADGPPVELAMSGPVTCDDPSLRDVAAFDTTDLRAEPPKKVWFWAGGVVAADFDGDGHHDVVLPGFWETHYYRGGPGDALDDVSTTLEGHDLVAASGGSAADYDGDGDLDLLITRFLQPDVLLRNEGDGTFVDVSREAGLLDQQTRSVASSWGDFDRDGDLDLFVGVYGLLDESGADPTHTTFEPADPTQIYVNQGDGTFVDIGPTLPREVHDGYTLTGGWFDLDRDGWLDLYVVNDFGQSYPSRLLWNREGQLELDGGSAGLDNALTAMGVAVEDLDGDEIDDVFITAWNELAIYESGAGGSWFDYTNQRELDNDLSRGQKIAWGVDLVDIDNDGDLDAPVAFGWLDSIYPAAERQPDAMYLQQDDGTFVDVGQAWVMNHPTAGRGYVPVDLDDDGYIDLVRRDLAGPTLLSMARCGNRSWLKVSARQPGMNTRAIGARVRVRVGDQVHWRTIRAGGTNYASAGPPEVHFGLGEAARADVVEVHWPDGAVSRIRDVELRQDLQVTRTQ